MQAFWQPGDAAILRGVFRQRVWAAQAVRVIHDTAAETALLLAPGAECAFPEGYWRWRHGDLSQGNRWTDSLGGAWRLRRTTWQTNRFVILLTPERYYATMLIWQAASDAFQCYYVNFQLPYRRTALGFDTLDLDLDIVVDPDGSWQWKDRDDYAAGLESGGITPEWAAGIAATQPGLIAAIEAKHYPFDETWLSWRPPAEWQTAALPEGWETI